MAQSPAKLRLVIGALRGRNPKFPGSCAQNAASIARSSRATTIPVSPSQVRASATLSFSARIEASPLDASSAATASVSTCSVR